MRFFEFFDSDQTNKLENFDRMVRAAICKGWLTDQKLTMSSPLHQ